jgi:hypothetical protein
MAKGKMGSGKNYTSKGEVGVNKALLKDVKRSRPGLTDELNAWKSWKKGSPTPKLIQKALGITAKVSHQQWMVAHRTKKENG